LQFWQSEFELLILPFRLESLLNIDVATRNADEVSDDRLARIFYCSLGDAPLVRRLIARLKKNKLNIFYEKL